MTDPSFRQMYAVDEVLSHIWMVRTFLKHCDEATEDEELASVHRDLYDYMLALGPSYEAKDPVQYLKLAKKKLAKLKRCTALFTEIQPEVSGHMNFKMAAKSLQMAVLRVSELLSPEWESKLNSSTSSLSGIDADSEKDEGDEDN